MNGEPRVEIPAVCEIHGGPRRVVVGREGDRLVLEGHADACCVLSLPAAAVIQVVRCARAVAGMSGRASWVLGSDGLAHLPVLEGPGTLVTGCQRSLPDATPHTGVVPQGQRRCPECFAALMGPRDLAPQTPAGRRPDPPAPAGCPYCGSTRGVTGPACESPRVLTATENADLALVSRRRP